MLECAAELQRKENETLKRILLEGASRRKPPAEEQDMPDPKAVLELKEENAKLQEMMARKSSEICELVLKSSKVDCVLKSKKVNAREREDPGILVSKN